MIIRFLAFISSILFISGLAFAAPGDKFPSSALYNVDAPWKQFVLSDVAVLNESSLPIAFGSVGIRTGIPTTVEIVLVDEPVGEDDCVTSAVPFVYITGSNELYTMPDYTITGLGATDKGAVTIPDFKYPVLGLNLTSSCTVAPVFIVRIKR